MTDAVKKPLLLTAGTPPKPPTYGSSPALIELMRFWRYMQILKEVNEKFFAGNRDVMREEIERPKWNGKT